MWTEALPFALHSFESIDGGVGCLAATPLQGDENPLVLSSSDLWDVPNSDFSSSSAVQGEVDKLLSFC